MNEKELISLIEYTLDSKIDKNENIVIYSFYELRVKYNLTEEETNNFIYLLNNKMQYMGYKLFFTGEEYSFNDEIKTVKSNELVVAIKNRKDK